MTVLQSRRTFQIVAIASMFLVLLAILLWLGLPRLQAARAGGMLGQADDHIMDANKALERLGMNILAIEGFTSLDSISAAQQSLAGSAEELQAASDSTAEAAELVDKAGGLVLLPDWFDDYLQKKEQLADLRNQQLELLAEASGRLDELFQAAPLIFQSMEEMDRLLGRLEAAVAKTQDDPSAASAELAAVAGSMKTIQQQLDEQFQQSGFNLLEQMSRNVADNAALAQAAGSLADAVSTGDQNQVQQAAGVLEQQLLDTTVGVDYLDLWLRSKIKPLKKDYDELQLEQEDLDREAAAIYEESSGR